jgi:pimeloyl-ACP methyl ester carboxylesterase/DNA-binding winged helix-turn-helix (wHTH) protein
VDATAYQFGGWRVEPGRNRVCCGDVEKHLEPLSMDILAYLLAHPHETVSADQLLDAIWRDRIVEANAVHRAIALIRRALGDDSQRPQYIETIRKRGYRTIAPVNVVRDAADSDECNALVDDVETIADKDSPGAATGLATPVTPKASPERTDTRWTRWHYGVVGAVVLIAALPIAYYHRHTLMLTLVLNAPALFFGEAIQQQLGFATASDGTRIAYATSGTGRPIVYVLTIGTHLENGQSSPFYDHDGLVAMSSRANFFVRYDGRGFGLSDRNVNDYSLDARVRDLEAVVNAIGLERFGILAVSAGGPPAIAYTARYPERVTRLVLAGTVASYDWLDDAARMQYERFADLIEVAWNRPEVAGMFADLLLTPEGGEFERRFLGEMLQRAGDGAAVASFQRASLELDVREQAKQIRVPTLIIHARGDMAVPFAAGREMASLIPGSRFEIVEGGHMSSSASHAAVRRRALAFFAETE